LATIEAALKLDPRNGTALGLKGRVLNEQGVTAEAIAAYRAALKLAPKQLGAANNLAWLLATKGSGAADFEEAVQLGERICKATDFKQPELIDTLAMSYAAAGRFADAIRVTQQALALAKQSSNAPLADLMAKRLAAYRESKLPDVGE